jgi:hypothetical protein
LITARTLRRFEKIMKWTPPRGVHMHLCTDQDGEMTIALTCGMFDHSFPIDSAESLVDFHEALGALAANLIDLNNRHAERMRMDAAKRQYDRLGEAVAGRLELTGDEFDEDVRKAANKTRKDG